MTPQRWAQIRDIFEEAVERPDAERAAYLNAVCASDEELRNEVQSLLHSHQASADFLATPIVRLGRMIASEDERDDYPAGYRVGSYQLERRLGRGGMGTVWLATRHDQEFHKQVAIKLVKRGMDSREILRRFRTERQVLANLDHPNIARLIDGGSTPDGLPYLVMEYVEGVPIDRFCDEQNCSIDDRLRLFRMVCAAVHYAHQNLVVHRDIKAGNILVTRDGVPKLLDFGIAKLLDPEGSSRERAQTRPDMPPMTLDYASPEQVRGEVITTATDVYSMGVLLFRLLTGKLPFDWETHSHTALRNAISDVDPPRPSSLVAGDRAAGGDAEKARKRLRKKLAGDLDNMILMALRKEPHRRYLSAEQFAEDIERHLEGRAVIARLDTPGYQLGRLLARNGEFIAATFIISAALISIAALSQKDANDARMEQAREANMLQQVRHELVQAYLRSRAADQAYQAAREELQASPTNLDALRDVGAAAAALGDRLLAQGNRAGAVSRYRESLELMESVAAGEGSQVNEQTKAELTRAAKRLKKVTGEDR